MTHSSLPLKRGLRVALVALFLVAGTAAAESFLVVSFAGDVPEGVRIDSVKDGFNQSLLLSDDPASIEPLEDGTWRIATRVPLDRLLHTVVIIESTAGRFVVTPIAASTHIDRIKKYIYLTPLTPNR